MILGIARYINSISHDELPHIIGDSRSDYQSLERFRGKGLG